MARPQTGWWRFAGGALVVLTLLNPAAVVAAQDDDDEGGGNVGVVIVGPTPTPTPTPTGTVSPSPSPSGTGVPPDPDESPSPTPTPSPTGESGFLQLSGLTAWAVPSINPFGGSIRVELTVRNGSPSTLYGHVRFRLDDLFGSRLDNVQLAFVRLRPGETRTIRTELDGPGQWPLVHVTATLTTPVQIDDVDVPPLTRDTWVPVLPWLFLVLAILIAAGIVIRRIIRRGAGDPV